MRKIQLSFLSVHILLQLPLITWLSDSGSSFQLIFRLIESLEVGSACIDGMSMKVEPNYATAKKHGILPCIIVYAYMLAAIFRANLFTQGAYYQFL